MDPILELIPLLLAAVNDAAAWQEFLERFCNLVNSDQCLMMVGDIDLLSPAVLCLWGAPVHEVQEYFSTWKGQDPWLSHGALDYPPGEVVASQNLISDEELEALPVYREFLLPRQWHYGMGCVILSNETGVSTISTLRAKAKGPFTEPEMDVLRRLYPHLEIAARAYSTLARVRQQNRFFVSYAEHLPCGFALVDGQGGLLLANSMVDRLARDFPTAVKRSARLEIQDPETGQTLTGVLARGAGKTQRFTVHIRNNRALAVLVTPSRETDLALDAPMTAFSVIILDPEKQVAGDTQLVADLFGLTPAEARLALLLASGLSVEEAARSLEISVNTARTHVKRALAKTNTKRQSELIRLILSANAIPGLVDPHTPNG